MSIDASKFHAARATWGEPAVRLLRINVKWGGCRKSKGPLRCGDGEAQKNIFGDKLHFQRSAVEEWLGYGVERCCVQRVSTFKKEDVVNIACAKGQAWPEVSP